MLYAFTGGVQAGPDGAWSDTAVVLDANGNIYGTKCQGGAFGWGIVFKVTPSGKATILHTLAGGPDDGGNSETGLVFDAEGTLYGTTSGGGAYGYGTVFKLVP